MVIKKSGVFCASVAFLLHCNTFWADFAYDDTRAIIQNEDVLPSSSFSNLLKNDFWGTSLTHSGSHKSFRPITTLTFKLNYLLSGGLYPGGFHVANVILHALATYFFSVLAFKIWPNDRQVGPSLAALLFAVHPIHTEAVAGIVGRADILSGIFFILAILNYSEHVQSRVDRGGSGNLDKNGNLQKHHGSQCDKLEKKYLTLCAVYAFCAMFSKEQGITVLGVCFIADLLDVFCCQKGKSRIRSADASSSNHHFYHQCQIGQSKQKMKIKSLCFLILAAFFLLGLRVKAMGFKTPKFAKADNPIASNESVLTRFLTFMYLPVFNAFLLVCPNTLSFDWSMDSIALIASIFDRRNIFSLMFYGFLLRLSLTSVIEPLFSTRRDGMGEAKNKILTGFSLSIMILPFIPASNLLFYVGFVVAERILYIPSMGFCLLSAQAIEQVFLKVLKRRKMARFGLAICLLLLVLCGGFKTITRNQDWQNEEQLYRSGLSINPAKAYGNLANVLTQQGRLVESEKALKLALEHKPNMADAHYNMGVLYQRQNRLTEAVQCYRNAIHYRHKLVLAHLNLGLAYDSLGWKEEALRIQKNILTIDDDGLKDPKTHIQTQISAMLNVGKLYMEMSKPAEAISVLYEAKKKCDDGVRYPNLQGLYNLMGEAYQMLNKSLEAEKWYRSALQLKPDHLPAYLRYGKLLARNKTRHNEAEHWFSKAKLLAPQNPSVAMHYGLFLMDSNRNLEAAIQFELSVNLSKPNNVEYESLFNAGVAYRLAGKLEKAEMYYRQATDMKPEDSSSHMNLGAMLHLVGKLSEAEQHYLEAWKLNPGDSATKTNIQRLQRIMINKGMKVKKVGGI